MAAPHSVLELVERFDRNIEAYKSGAYNETQVRREFIDPFFDALGWDVSNKSGFAEAYKDVIHEYSQKTADTTEAPDYLFRIGGTRKFFVEAKKPSVKLADDIYPAYQLRRYAWTAKLPLSILTDFEEFAVYDCRIKPDKNDKASTARINIFNYKDYPDKWDEINSVFSKDAVLKGSFDKFAETNKGKRGTAEVDDAFLHEIELWRESLARNIALRNPNLTNRELNYSVQKNIDRIIFLRICEDRGIEEYGQLLGLMNGANVYGRLLQIFTRADEKYNSGLFHFEFEKEITEAPDEITPKLSIDDKTLKDIIKTLYYPDSPYEFSVLPADILGHVYEQFLGKVIRLTPGHQAKIEEKPEVKKAGGVYYTPTYIVDYIVKNTVGKKLEDKTPKEISKLKILDPACGSGSFLLGAYQYLLDWHLEYYASSIVENGQYKKMRNAPVYQSANGELKLSTAERKRILLNNIYGVDIDPQAVEVTKLSLLLKVLEGETDETITNQFKLFRIRALPDLSNNIKCGNSLIGPDFYDGNLFSVETHHPSSAGQVAPSLQFDDEDRMRINVFDWKEEFKTIMKDGGFDVVIGNPPYVRQELIIEYKNYFQSKYKVYHGAADLYSYFIEKAVSLLKEEGYFSYIVANKWMRANYGANLRGWLLKQNIIEIVDFGDLQVFKRATTYPCIITINKGNPSPAFTAAQITSLDFTNLKDEVNKNLITIEVEKLNEGGWSLTSENKSDLIQKIFKQGIPLSKYVNGKIYYGIKTGLNKAFVINEETKNKLIAEDPKSAEVIKPFLAGRDIKRYAALKVDKYLIFFPKGWTNRINAKKGFKVLEEMFPAIAEHLKPFEIEAKKRFDQGDYWWELRACDYYNEFETPKIVIPAIANKANYSLDRNGIYSNDKTSIIAGGDLYLLGLINSKVLDYILKSIASTKQNGYYEYKPMYVSRLPIVQNPKEEIKSEIEAKVFSIIELNKEILSLKLSHEQQTLQRQINAIDKQIDKLVYELYGLTEDEIKIVEGG
ncbi:MAG: N-6 DNA methylase [bacterium]